MLAWLAPLLSICSGLFKWFQRNRDEQVGALKEDNKTLASEFDDVEKAKTARNGLDDPAARKLLDAKYRRD